MIGSYWKETSTTIETPVLVPAGGIVVLRPFFIHSSRAGLTYGEAVPMCIKAVNVYQRLGRDVLCTEGI